jgi:enamine deaminase RidA (YjgF/YER057c/UK114 family)
MATIERVPSLEWAKRFDFEQAWVVGDTVYTSGHGAFGADGAVGSSDFETQARLMLNNLKATLEAAGCSLDEVVKQTIYFTNADDVAKWIDIRREFYNPPYPCTTGIVVKELLFELIVEIDAIAVRGARRTDALAQA